MKTIKSRGKGLKLSEVDRLMKGPQRNDVDEDDDDEYEPGDSSESESDDYPSRVPGDEDEDEDYEDEGSEIGTDGIDSGREAVNRLKDDLFADDDEEPTSGIYIYLCSSVYKAE